MPVNSDLRLLSKQERALRISLTNVKEFVESYRRDQDASLLQVRLEKLDEILEKFIDVRLRIELLTDEVDDEENFTDIEETEAARVQRQLKLQDERDQENAQFIKNFENEVYRLKHVIKGYLPSTSAVQSVQAVQQAAVQQSKVKLPELKLPLFSGRLSEWVTFRDTYKNLIHNDDRLSDMDKYTYLRTTLTGDALQEIAPIEMSSANYHIAWKALEDLYENKKKCLWWPIWTPSLLSNH